VTAESKDNVNDAEKGDLGKDNDTASVASDNEGGKTGKQGTLLSCLGHSTII